MVLLSFLRSAASNISSILNAAPGLKKLRSAGRISGLIGMLVQIGGSAIKSVTQLDPMIFIQTLGMNLVNVNRGLIAEITALKAGSEGLTFWWHTWGIYSKLWFILFITGAVAKYLKNVHLGDQVPKYQLYLVTFVFVITPVQLIGATIVEVVQTGSLKREQLWQVLNFWKGVRMVASSPDLWIEPVRQAIQSMPLVEAPSGPTGLNQTANNIQTLDG